MGPRCGKSQQASCSALLDLEDGFPNVCEGSSVLADLCESDRRPRRSRSQMLGDRECDLLRGGS